MQKIIKNLKKFEEFKLRRRCRRKSLSDGGPCHFQRHDEDGQCQECWQPYEDPGYGPGFCEPLHEQGRFFRGSWWHKSRRSQYWRQQVIPRKADLLRKLEDPPVFRRILTFQFHRRASGSLYFAGSKAVRANIGMLRHAIYHNLDSLNVGFPHMIRSSMRMAHFNAKMSTLSTNRAYSHR